MAVYLYIPFWARWLRRHSALINLWLVKAGVMQLIPNCTNYILRFSLMISNTNEAWDIVFHLVVKQAYSSFVFSSSLPMSP